MSLAAKIVVRTQKSIFKSFEGNFFCHYSRHTSAGIYLQWRTWQHYNASLVKSLGMREYRQDSWKSCCQNKEPVYFSAFRSSKGSAIQSNWHQNGPILRLLCCPHSKKQTKTIIQITCTHSWVSGLSFFSDLAVNPQDSSYLISVLQSIDFSLVLANPMLKCLQFWKHIYTISYQCRCVVQSSSLILLSSDGKLSSKSLPL